MIDAIYACSPRCARWTLRRNPMYLMSAVLMAVGARLLLVTPAGAAGDIKLILATLAVLQVYEWAVSGILVLLHRYRRSPEDQPFLLLVAILFWTGPMAATIEMTALRIDLGIIVAAAACLIALGELGFIQRGLSIHMSLAPRLTGAACVLFLTAVPPLLRVPDSGAGPNELWLYAAWWVLAAIALTTLISFRSPPMPGIEGAVSRQITFPTLTLGATALHLVGMGHAFFCHAAWFYASPLIVAASIVAVEHFVRTGRRNHPALLFVSALPLGAILLATRPFDPNVPVDTLPLWLRDPMPLMSAIAAAAWWFGYLRHGYAAALHAGSTSLAWAAYRAVRLFSPRVAAEDVDIAPNVTPDVFAFALFAAAAYMAVSALIRRCRTEAFLSLLANLAAVALLSWQNGPAGWFVLLLAMGWTWLLGTHLLRPRPPVLLQVLPIAFLLVFTCGYDFSPALVWYARAHGLVLIGGLLLAGLVWPWTAYRWIAAAAAAAYVAFLLWRWVGLHSDPIAAGIVTGSFALLLAGTTVSWHKQRLLIWANRGAGDRADQQVETNYSP